MSRPGRSAVGLARVHRQEIYINEWASTGSVARSRTESYDIISSPSRTRMVNKIKGRGEHFSRPRPTVDKIKDS